MPTEAGLLNSLIDGLLLGDGSISPHGRLSIGQCARRKGWLFQAQRLLRRCGVSSRVHWCDVAARRLEGRMLPATISWRLYTPHCAVFRLQRRRWYPNGVKIVPTDVNLSPRALAHWLVGDGSGLFGGGFQLCTNGFTRSDVDMLSRRLNEAYGIDSRVSVDRRNGGPVIRFQRVADGRAVAKMVRRFMPKCALYKLQHVRESDHANAKLTAAEVRKIRAVIARGDKLPTVASRFKISRSLACQIGLRQIYRWV